MKRLVLLFAMLLAAVTSSAQIRIVENENPTRKVAELTGVSALMVKDSTYFILMATDNRYDDGVILPLGEGKEKALEALDGLEVMMTEIMKGKTFYIYDALDVEYFVQRIPMTKAASLSSREKAGKATLHATAIQRAKKAMQRE